METKRGAETSATRDKRTIQARSCPQRGYMQPNTSTGKDRGPRRMTPQHVAAGKYHTVEYLSARRQSTYEGLGPYMIARESCPARKHAGSLPRTRQACYTKAWNGGFLGSQRGKDSPRAKRGGLKPQSKPLPRSRPTTSIRRGAYILLLDITRPDFNFESLRDIITITATVDPPDKATHDQGLP